MNEAHPRPCVSQAEQRLLQLLVETSLRVREPAPSRRSAGRCSPYDVDCKKALALPEARALIGAVIVARFAAILARVDAVGGLELGAYPLAMAIADAAYRDARPRTLQVFVIRKAPKPHGRAQQLEGLTGAAEQRKKVLLVDDVLRTGDSMLQALTVCRALGVEVVHTLVLLDLEEAAPRQRLAQAGVACDALFTLGMLKNLSMPYGGKKTQTSGGTVQTPRTPPLGRLPWRTRGVSIGYAIRAYLEAHPQERDRLAQKYGWVD
jgi:orotate phosphoribosyltransferase